MDTTDNPEFKPFTNDFTEEEALNRRARAIAATKNLFQTDISKLDDAQVSGLYQATARALFQIEDPDGKVAFDKKAGDARTNVGLLRDFCKGNYKLIQDDEYETWRAMDEEQKFRYALENESKSNKAKSNLGGQRGAGLAETLATGGMYSGVGLPAGAMATARMFAGPKVEEDANAQWNELARRSNYESLTPEEQAVYRKDVIDDYEKKLSKRQVLATYLAMTDGLSDRASTLLAKAYNTGTVDVEAMETLPQKERDQAYTALSIMRGDQKKGHLLFYIPTDFTDDTAANRLQLCLYGFQQGVLGLIPNTYEFGKDAAKWAYAKFRLDDAERKRYIDRWDAQVRAEQALKQGLPEADSWLGAGLQGAAESFALMVPYLGIGKGGKLMRAATAVNKDASWLKRTAAMLNPLRAGSQHRARAKLVEGVKAVEEAEYADTFARLSQWKTVGGGDLTVGNQLLARQLANIENYTKELRELKKLSGTDLAKWGLGAAEWSAGEATAFGSFAKEYVETCDAAGISRYDSVPMAAIVGLINAQIEHLYVPGLESTLSASEVKSLTVGSLLQTIKSDGAKGFWKWLGNRVEKGVVEGGKVVATEGGLEEPAQQIVIEHGKAISATAQKLREEGRGDLADQLSAYWDATKDTLATDFQTFVDTAIDSLPSSVVFGATTIGNQTRRQHLHNIMTRHENRAKYAREVERAKAEGREIPAPPVMLTRSDDGKLDFNPNGVDYDVGIADMIGKAAATQKAVTDYWAGNGQEKEGEDVRLANAFTAARKAWDSADGDALRKIADAAQVDMRTAEVIAEYFIAEDETKLYSPQLRAFADYSLSAADMSEGTLERILPGYVKGSYKADEKNGVYSGQVKLEDGSVKTIAYKVGDISEELLKSAEEQIGDDSELGKSHDARIRSGDGNGEKLWAKMTEQERYAYAIRGVNAFAGGAGVVEVTEADGTVSRISADDVIYLSNGRFGDVGYGPMATLGTARHETWHAIWRFTKSSFTEAERQNLAKKLGVDVTADNWETELDEAMAYQFELYASGAHVPHVATGAIDRLMQSTAAKWIGELSKFGLADEVKNAKTGKPFALADFYDAVMRGEIGTGRLGIAQVATETPPQKAAEPQKKTRKELPVGVSEEELAEAEGKAAEAAAETEPEAPEHTKPQPSAQATQPQPDYTLDSPADASVPDARFYRISAGDGVDLVGELVVSDARDLKTSYKGNLSDPSLQNRAETNEGRSLVEKIAGSPDPLQVGTVQPRANNGFVWTTPSLDTFIGNTRESGISAAYEKGTAAAVKAYMLAEAEKRGIEVPEGIEQPIVHFVLRSIESKDGKASIQDVVRMTNQSVNRGMNVYEQAKNDADVLVGAGLVPHIAIRPDGRIDTAKSAEAIGRFIQETGAQGMVDENTDTLTEDGQARLQNAVLAALLGNENADTVAKMMREADRLDIENEKRALMKTAAELMRIAAAKPQYDLRQPLAEALDYYLNWRDVDERKREEAGKNRRDWYERTKDGMRKRGLTWSMHMGQGDMFRTPSPEARLLGDLLAASRDLRSFDAEDRETDAGKKRAQDLVTGFLGDYITNADAVNTETVDLLGTPPPSRIELLETHRGTDDSRRFSTVVSPTLREDVEAALNTDRTKGEIVKGEKRVVFCDTPGLLRYVGMPNAKIYSKAYALRKIANDHNVTADQIAGVPELMNHPAAIFNDNGEGYVILTDANVPDANGVLAPMMIYLRPDGEGNYLASAYSRTEDAEAKYVNLANSGKVLYLDKNKVANLTLRGEALSSLSTFSIGDNVATPERVTANSIAQSAAKDNVVRFSTVAANLSTESRLRRTNASTQTDTPTFKAWFADSKIVDGEGRPLRVYRGAEFNPVKQPDGKGVIKPMSYFSADPDYAKRYGEVEAYYLKIEHPFDIRDPECEADFKKVYPNVTLARGDSGALDWAEASTVDDEFLEENFPGKYDGIIFDEQKDWTTEGNAAKWRGLSYVPLFGGSQVKSATRNRGTFDPANPDIRFSVYGLKGAERAGIGTASEAERMERDGASVEYIWRTTGWWRGHDGKWRIDVDDEAFAEEIAAALEYEWTDDDGKDGKPNVASIIASKDLKSESLERLVKAYPELSETTLSIVPDQFSLSGKGPKADYNPDANEIRVFENAAFKDGKYDARAVAFEIVHEIQHAIQTIEGHPNGRKVSHGGIMFIENARDRRRNLRDTIANYGEIEAYIAQRRHIAGPYERMTVPPWEMERMYLRSANRQFGLRLGPKDIRFSTAGLYTGSAADYEKPSLLKVGTGEGSQVYGWGLYASSERGVAETYADMDAGSGDFSSRGNKAIKFKNRIIKVGDGSPDEIAADFIINWGDRAEEMITSDIENNIRSNDRGHAKELKAGLRSIQKFRKGFKIVELKPHLYEQTFFTNRAPGDESHLLMWYEPVSEENLKRIVKAINADSSLNNEYSKTLLKKAKTAFLSNLSNRIGNKGIEEATGADVYKAISELYNTNREQNASEFLARADIDGIKYPVDSYGGKTVKDGDKAGWNYVSFRDDNIRVDHKWVDGQQRFSTVQIEKNVDEMLSKLDEAKGKSKEEIFKQYNNEQKIIGALPYDINLPEALRVEEPVVKAAQAYMLDHLLNQPGHEFAYNADDAKRVIGLIDPRNEMRVVQQRNSSSLAFIGNNPKGGWDCIVIAPRRGEFYVFKTMFGQIKKPYQDKVQVRYSFGSSVRNEAVGSLLRGPLASIRDVDQTSLSIAQPSEESNAPRRVFSTVGSAYPALNRLSDEQLIAVALASKTVFGKAGKKQSRFFTINEVQRHIKALHPDWDGPKVSLESTRIYQLVRPIKAKLQEDIQRGVSESKILQHLPERLKEEFGSEMTQQARTGARIGTTHQRAASLLEERKVKVVEDAVRVQSGIESQLLENQYGVDLSRTLMNLADNPYLKKDGQGNYLPPPGSGTIPPEMAGAEAEVQFEEKDVDEKVKKAVSEIVGKTKEELDQSEANRRSLSDQRGRDAEREAELAGEANEGGGLDPADGDIVEIATRKASVDLQNPRHLALFVTELARRHWVKEHGLAENAEAFKDAVALQFLRKTAQDVYRKLVRDITYSQSRDSATAAINGFEHVPTLRGLISEMTFAGQLINARKIRETAQEMCEKLDTSLQENFGASGRFKPDNEELRRKVSTEMELRARYTRHAIWLTPNAAGKEADLLQKEIDAASADFEKEDHDAEQSRVMVENIRKINILREFGGLRYKPLAQIQSALEYWDNAQQGESEQIARENLEREIRTKKAAEVLAKAIRNPNTKYAKDGKKLLSAIDNYITGHMGFTHLLRDMMRYASKEDSAAAEKIVQYLELEIQKDGTRVMTQKRRHADALAKAVQQIYGRNFGKVLAEFCKEDERFAEFMGETDGKKDMPTKGRAMQLMVSLLQVGRQVEVIDPEDPKKTKLEWQGGYHDNIVKHHREGQAAKIAALLTPQDLQLVKWLGNWYDTNRQELSSVCQDLFGIGVYAETSNYMPVKMRLDAQGLEKGDAVGWTIFPKALMPRVRNERDFDTRADILQMFMARMEEGEQWKAHARLGLEMRGIFGRSELQAAVIASHGTKANAIMLGFVTDILAGQGARQRAASGDAVENYTDWIRGWAALGALGGNVGVTFKQTTSIPAFGFEVGLVKTGRYMLSAFTPDGMSAMKKIWDSDERKNRWNVGNSEAVANALAGNDVSLLKRLMRASMITNKVGDCVPGLVCGQGIYRDCIEQGMDEEDAMAKTWMLIERTQQSGRIENQAGFQRRTKFGRALYQFLTTQQQYLSYEARAIRSVAAKPGDLKRWGELGETLLLNHFLLSSAYYWMGQLYKRLLGQEPDDDGELADWMVTCLLGPYGALYGLGITTTEAVNTWIKGRQVGTQGQLPSLSWASNFIVHDPARLVGACFDEEKTFDDVLDAAAKWASDSNAIFRDLRKVYRWRIKEEPQ